MPAIAELTERRREVDEIKERARQLTSDLDHAAFNWRTEPGRWSIAECLAHLNETNRQYIAGIHTAIQDARVRHLFSDGPFRHGLIGNWLVRSLEPPPRFKTKTPARFAPPPEADVDEIMPEFMHIHNRVLELVEQAHGLDLKKIKIRSLVLPILRFDLGQYFALLTAHDRRHLWQAEQVRAARLSASRT